MSFKAIFLLSWIVFLSTACSQLFGEKPPVAAAPDINFGFEAQCLRNVLPVMKTFLSGSAKPAEISGTWQCFGKGITAFQTYVKGSQQNKYSATELVKFFEDYFFVNTKISPRLLTEVMHIKQIFVGGADDSLTKAELTRLSEFAKQMESISLELLPYMKVYAKTWLPEGKTEFLLTDNESVEFFENANLAMQKAAKDLAALIARNEHGYRIENFVTLMREMEKLYDDKWSWLTQFEKLLPLIEKFKGTLAGGDPGVVAPQEWRRFVLLGGRGYVQYLRFFYFVKNADLMSQNQLSYLTNSIDDLFSFLGDMVKEKPSGVFTQKELYEVIQALDRIFPTLNISKAFVEEAMKIKKLLFGGSEDSWTPNDFLKAQGKVQNFRILAEKLLNFSDLYLFKWKAQDLPDPQAQSYFEKGEANLSETMKILAAIIESRYDLESLTRLCNEIEKAFPTPADEDTWTKKIRRYMPVVIAYKQIILGDQDTVIQKENWKSFLQITGKIYARGLYAQYFLKDANLFQSPGLKSLDKMLSRTTDLLLQLLQTTPRGTELRPGSIQYDELKNLLAGFQKAGMWPKGVQLETAQNLLRVLIDRVLFPPDKRIAGLSPNGFGDETIAVIRAEYKLWSDNQLLLEKFYQPPQQEFSTGQILSFLQSEQDRQRDLKNLSQTQGTLELTNIYSSPVPLSIRNLGLLEMSPVPALYRFDSSQMVNLSRVISRIILRSYSLDMNRIQALAGINKQEVKVLFDEVKPLLVQLDLLEPENTTFASNRYMEANLFTPTGDGNDLMSFREGAHLALLVLSGLKLNSYVIPLIDKACPIRPRLDESAGENARESALAARTSVNCAIQVYFDNRAQFYQSMPEMKNYLMNLSQADFSALFVELLKATGWTPNAEGTAAIGDLGLVPHIFQYEEMMLQRFDLDKSGSINDSEAQAAYPIYGPLINEVSPTKIAAINRTIFYYLIKNGKIPEGFKEILDLLKDVIRMEVQNKPLGINSDRAKLAKVFGAIADAIRKPQPEVKPSDEFKNGVDVDGKTYPWEKN